jgi:hypothetical protein
MTIIKDHENRQLSKYFKKVPGRKRREKIEGYEAAGKIV